MKSGHLTRSYLNDLSGLVEGNCVLFWQAKCNLCDTDLETGFLPFILHFFHVTSILSFSAFQLSKLAEDIFCRKDQQKPFREIAAHSNHFVSSLLTFVNKNISEAIFVFKVGWLECYLENGFFLIFFFSKMKVVCSPRRHLNAFHEKYTNDKVQKIGCPLQSSCTVSMFSSTNYGHPLKA